MTRKLLIALTASAALAAPLAAQAQSTVTAAVGGTVIKGCDMGDPTVATLEIGDLTGTDGRLLPALAGSQQFTTTIEGAWCNAPSTLKLDGVPMGLTVVPSYGAPSGFSRLVTYNATLTGWPDSLVYRPKLNTTAVTTGAVGARAASLLLAISNLAPLDAAGTVETPTNVLEAGSYAGSVTVSVSVQ
jgi:hypothetical protein